MIKKATRGRLLERESIMHDHEEAPVDLTEKQVVVRNYGVLAPINWEKDCLDHLYLMNK